MPSDLDHAIRSVVAEEIGNQVRTEVRRAMSGVASHLRAALAAIDGVAAGAGAVRPDRAHGPP